MATGSGGEATQPMELDGEGAWTVAGASERREKRIKYAADDRAAHVVYITGMDEIITKMNPLKVREKLVLKIGSVDRIYISGKSLKVYCKNNEQRFTLLRSNKLDDINISCNEPIIGYRSGANPDSKVKQIRGVISGVSLDTTEEEIMESTEVTKVIRFHKIVSGVKTPTSSLLFIFEGDVLPPHVTLGFTRFCTRAFIPTPTRCGKCQRFGHVFKSCRAQETCSRCAGNHLFINCTTWTSPGARTAMRTTVQPTRAAQSIRRPPTW